MLQKRNLLFSALAWLASSLAARADSPNIVVILTDDQGYADISLNPHHPPEVATPHMDALAQKGVVCTQGYTSGHVCSPTRAGLMTGRYQQRFGVYTAGEGGAGVSLDEQFFPQYLAPAGYVSGVIGKWHQGVDIEYNPIHRGFDEFYGFMGRGAHDYFDLNIPDHPIYRGLEPISDEGYLTDRITEEAVDFITRHRKQPFFLYVAYNAVHAPAQAPEADIQNETGDELRDTLMAMLRRLDSGVGEIVTTLEEAELFDNTLMFFLSDNGGSKAMNADNAPLRGFKQNDYEGGVRVPFFVSWPERLPAGSTSDVPVMSIDILPTALAAAGIAPPEDRILDGRNMLPALLGEDDSLHEHLYWSSAGESGKWAIRSGQWKLVAIKDQIELFDLDDDVGEEHDLAEMYPERVAALTVEHSRWLDEMAEPQNGAPKRWSRDATSADVPNRQPDMTGVPGFETPSGRPNVLLIVCDDLNTHVSTSDYPHIITPAFNRLASAGTRFTRAYCQYPVCNPSRSSFLSGLYPESSGVLDNRSDLREVRPGTITLPESFQNQAYWTGGVGKVFHGNMDPGEVAWHTFRQFDNEWNPVLAAAQREFESEHGSIELEENRRRWQSRQRELQKAAGGQTPPGFGPTDMTDEQHRDGKNARQIVEWIDQRPFGDAPFFMVCGIHKPHVPFWAPREYFDMYPLDELAALPVPTDDWDDIPPRAMNRRFEGFGFELGVQNDSLRRQYTQAYHACITFIDAQMNLMFDALDRNELWDDTIVILTSDHGYHLGEHFMWGKVTLFEECARVPLIIHVPGMTDPGSTSEGLVELVDLYPTLSRLCRLETPAGLQGRSLEEQLADPEAEGGKVAYTVVTRGESLGRSIRTSRWRYAEWDGPEENELYHLRRDPSEYENLADDDEFANVVSRMRKMLHSRSREAAARRGND